jgi:ABC-2 type transport system ATP-binding protein
VSGEGLLELSARLATAPGVDMVAPFGTNLHVSGRDVEALEAAIETCRGDLRLAWMRSTTSLEDVFIELMHDSRARLQ